jgi:hypothetical protein
MFRALFVHPQEALNKRHLVYCVRIVSGGCTGIGVELVCVMSVGCTGIGVELVCYVSWLHRDWSGTGVLCQLAAPGLKWNWCVMSVGCTEIGVQRLLNMSK